MTAWFSKSTVAETKKGPPSTELSHGSKASQTQLAVVSLQPVRSITLLEEARNAIAEASSLGEIRAIRDKAEAARNYAQAAGMGLEIQNYAAEVKLRAERRAGELLAELKLHGGDRSWERATSRLTLRDIGVSKDQSSRWQLAAKVPEEKFEEYLRSAKEKSEEVTTAGLVRIAAKLNAKSKSKGERDLDEAACSNCRMVSDCQTLVSENQRFACVYLDPPWPGGEDNNSFLLALAEMPIRKLSQEHSHVHIWATDDSLFAAREVLEQWGYEFGACLVAISKTPRRGRFWAETHEYLVLGVRGMLSFMEQSIESVSKLERDSGGRPSEGVRKLIERVSPGPYLELFGRTKVSNWTVHSLFIEGDVSDAETTSA